MRTTIHITYEPDKLVFQDTKESQCEEFCTDSIKVYNGSYLDQPVFVYKINQENEGVLKDKDKYIAAFQAFRAIPPHPCIQKFISTDMESFLFICEPVPHLLFSHMVNTTRQIQQNFQALRTNHKRKPQLSDEIYNFNLFTPTDKSIFIYALACGILHIHAHNVTHRNLNPKTIAVSENNLPVITSFFNSQIAVNNASKLMMTNISSDDAIFKAPEINLGVAFNNKVDVFSYAMVLQGFATGTLPYLNGLNLQELKKTKKNFSHQAYDPIIYKKIIDGNRPELSKEPGLERLNALIVKCWDADPEKRPSFSDIIIELNEGPMFPGTDEERYKTVTKEIFQKTDIPQDSLNCFDQREREKYRELAQKYDNQTLTDSELFQLAEMSETGKGCMVSLERAIHCYHKLSKSKNPQALAALYKLAIISSRLLKILGQEQYVSQANESFQKLYQAHFYDSYLLYSQFLRNYYYLLSKTQIQANEDALRIEKELLDYYLHQKNPDLATQISQTQYEIAQTLINLADLKYASNKGEQNKCFQEAETLLNQSRTVNKTANALLVNVLLRQDRENEAVEIAKKEKVEHPCGSILLKYGELCEEGKIMEDGHLFEALKSYEKANRFGNVIARKKAARLYEKLDEVENANGVPISDSVDLDRAAQLYEDAANMGDTECQLIFGKMLYEGRGIGKCYVAALSYLQEAAKISANPPCLEAMVRVGEMFLKGEKGSIEDHIHANVQLARQYFQRAINLSPYFKSSENDKWVAKAREDDEKARKEEEKLKKEAEAKK